MALTSIIRAGALPNSAEKTHLHSLIADATINISDIANADINAAAAIADTKLATISTAGKVNTSALTTTSQAAGDILYSPEGVTWVRLPKGSAGQKLRCRYGNEGIVLCSHFNGSDGATAYSDGIAGAYTFFGTAQLDTAQKKFGTASLLLDGNGDYVTLPDNARWYFGANNFTIELWVRFSSLSLNQGFACQYQDVDNQWWFYKAITTHKLTWFSRFAGANTGEYSMTNNWSPVVDTWYHIAFVRSNESSPKGLIFIDGIKQTVTESISFGTNDIGNIAGTFRVGIASGIDDYYMNGWIDEARVTSGTARWTADFTPQTSAYPLIPTWEDA